MQYSLFIVLYLGSIGMDRVLVELANLVINGQFYIEIIGKLPFHGHFPIIPL